jgi:hypothetical protein
MLRFELGFVFFWEGPVLRPMDQQIVVKVHGPEMHVLKLFKIKLAHGLFGLFHFAGSKECTRLPGELAQRGDV